MGHEFDLGIEVRPLGEGRYAAHLGEGWHVGGGVNGGYLLAVMGNAIRNAVPDKPDPLTFAINYVGPSVPGPATVVVRTVRDGRGTATLAVDLLQDDQVRATGLATYGDLAGLPAEVRTTARPPEIPPVEQCVSSMEAPEEMKRAAPLMSRFDMRLDPATAGWAVGEPTGEGRIQAWLRMSDGREPDPLLLLLAADALPPVTFDLGLPGWAPTLELTVHVRARPAPGWLQVGHLTRNVAGGMFEEDCEVWDSAGRLVVQSRQLAKLPR